MLKCYKQQENDMNLPLFRIIFCLFVCLIIPHKTYVTYSHNIMDNTDGLRSKFNSYYNTKEI